MRSTPLCAALLIACIICVHCMNLSEQALADRCLLYALYESFLPINGIAFFIAAYKPSSSEISRIVRMVLEARRTLTRDIRLLDNFHNLSSKVRWSSVSFPIGKLRPDSVESLIAMRNEIVSSDTSHILRKYIEEGQEESDGCLLDLSKTFGNSHFRGQSVESLVAQAGKGKRSYGIAAADGKNKSESNGYENKEKEKQVDAEYHHERRLKQDKGIQDNKQQDEIKKKTSSDREHVLKRDREYVDMIMRIVSSVKKNSNLARTLDLEKDMFYRMRIEVPEAASLKVRRAVSLGGGVIVPVYLAEMLKKLKTSNGEEKIREWVRVLLEPVRELELRSKLLELKEQKALIIDFLESCLNRSDALLEKAFEARSEILKMAYGTTEEREKENLRQEKAVMEMLRLIRGMDLSGKGDDFWFVKYSKDIETRFYEYLVMRTFEAKKRLLSYLE